MSAFGAEALWEILLAIRPEWSQKQTAAAVTKLAKVGIETKEDLEKALAEGLNEKLQLAGQKTFNADTVRAMRARFGVKLKRNKKIDSGAMSAASAAEDTGSQGVASSWLLHAPMGTCESKSEQDICRPQDADQWMSSRSLRLCEELQDLRTLTPADCRRRLRALQLELHPDMHPPGLRPGRRMHAQQLLLMVQREWEAVAEASASRAGQAEDRQTPCEELAFSEKVADMSASPKAQPSRRELQLKPNLKSAAERAVAEERANQAANEQAFTEIDVQGHYHIVQDSVPFRELAKGNAAKVVAEKDAAEKKLMEEQAAKFPAEKATVAKETAEKELAFADKVAEMSASPKAQPSKREPQLKRNLKSAAERAVAEERANQAADEQEFTEIDVEGHYHVVQDRVVLRKGPSIDAGFCGLGGRDMELVGTPCQVGETTWLRLNIEQSTALGAIVTDGVTQAWILIDGTILGQSLLLQRSKEAERETRGPIEKLVAECQTTLHDQPLESGRLWVVVGGAGNGGIIVRRECDFQSTAFSMKLARGTLIQELELQGNRLHYKRIHGDGPDFGWVTIEQNGQHLVQIYGQADEVEEKIVELAAEKRALAKEKAAKVAAEKAAVEKKLAEEQAAKIPAEKAAVAKESETEELNIAEKIAELLAKAQPSKKGLQLKLNVKLAAERAVADERTNQDANEQSSKRGNWQTRKLQNLRPTRWLQQRPNWAVFV